MINPFDLINSFYIVIILRHFTPILRTGVFSMLLFKYFQVGKVNAPYTIEDNSFIVTTWKENGLSRFSSHSLSEFSSLFFLCFWYLGKWISAELKGCKWQLVSSFILCSPVHALTSVKEPLQRNIAYELFWAIRSSWSLYHHFITGKQLPTSSRFT